MHTEGPLSIQRDLMYVCIKIGMHPHGRVAILHPRQVHDKNDERHMVRVHINQTAINLKRQTSQ